MPDGTVLCVEMQEPRDRPGAAGREERGRRGARRQPQRARDRSRRRGVRVQQRRLRLPRGRRHAGARNAPPGEPLGRAHRAHRPRHRRGDGPLHRVRRPPLRQPERPRLRRDRRLLVHRPRPLPRAGQDPRRPLLRGLRRIGGTGDGLPARRAQRRRAVARRQARVRRRDHDRAALRLGPVGPGRDRPHQPAVRPRRARAVRGRRGSSCSTRWRWRRAATWSSARS